MSAWRGQREPRNLAGRSRIARSRNSPSGAESATCMVVSSASPMSLHHVDIVFQMIVFLFAISVHESAHAWTANLRGDPTARMLGRVSLNPIHHIDPIGTVVLPLIAIV